MNPLFLVAAAGKDPPLIDLDWTVLVTLVLFLVTAFVLTRFLFRPYLAVRAARDAGIAGARDEARRMDEEARARMGDYETSLARAKIKANEERTKLRQEATERERAVTDAARARTMAALEEARGRLGKESAAARADLAPRANEIAREMAAKILGREVRA